MCQILAEIWDDKRELDNKGSILLTANGIVLGFVANAFDKLNYIVALIGLFLLILSIIFCIILLLPHNYTRSMCESHALMSKLSNDQLSRKIYDEVKGCSSKNRITIETLVKWYRRAIYSFLIALLSIAASIVLPYLS